MKAGMVDLVKEWQRRGIGYKTAWDNYCWENGHSKYDPNLKDEAFLQSFLEGANNGTITPVEETASKGGWSGGGGYGKGGGKGGKGGSGNDWWNMDPWTMMTMMKGMMGKMGKGGGWGGGGGGGTGDWGGGGGGGGGVSVDYEIRYDDPTHTAQAIQSLNGSSIKGGQITVQLDPRSKDGTKLVVSGIPAGLHWKAVKDHFGQIGTVAFAGPKDESGGKGGKGFSPY